MGFENIQNKIGEYLIIDKESDYLLEIILAVAISLEFDRPLWVMIQAPSSSGKSENLKFMDGLPDFHKLFSLTGKTLFSGHDIAEGGYIPIRIKEKGILCLPDFTSVLSASANIRNEIFSQLRMAYDGEGSRGTGVNVKSIKTWHGKIALIIGVTDVIEKIKNKMTDLGERFIYYRHDITNIDFRKFKYDKGKNNREKEKEIQRLITDLVLEKRSIVAEIEFPSEIEGWILQSCIFIAQTRAVVERGSYNKEINYIHKPEMPFRLAKQLRTLYLSLKSFQNDESRILEILYLVINSCIPELRKKIIDKIIKNGPTEVKVISKITGYSAKFLYRELQDMQRQKLLIRIESENPKKWQLHPEFQKLYESIFSNNSVSVKV
ncbi:MAG: hypothetical protein HN641_10490 [Candidatus Marinimicrobia bacterium]|jgi:hypothetical protein|nr:hypothetical protein [Candidatus Neomarinimicrobiota bacterium]